jgi:hypothetical protein
MWSGKRCLPTNVEFPITAMKLTAEEQAYFRDIEALEEDHEKRIVFVGLDHAESLELKQFRDSYPERESWPDPQRYRELMVKHERARLRAQMASSAIDAPRSLHSRCESGHRLNHEDE